MMSGPKQTTLFLILASDLFNQANIASSSFRAASTSSSIASFFITLLLVLPDFPLDKKKKRKKWMDLETRVDHVFCPQVQRRMLSSACALALSS